MEILSKVPSTLGTNWFLVKYTDKLYSYGVGADLEPSRGYPVSLTGYKDEVLSHCKSTLAHCDKLLLEYQDLYMKEKTSEWKMIIERKQAEKKALCEFIKILSE